MQRLKKRAEFLAVARGARAGRRAFLLQAAPVADGIASPRVGFTVTKKVGNSPERNRVRRRMRAAVEMAAASAAPGLDYVVVGKREALGIAFSELVSDLRGAFSQARRKAFPPASSPERSPSRPPSEPGDP